MIKKHYIAIANIIKDTSTSNGIYTYKQDLVNHLSNLFKLDNTRFNKDKFVNACNK